MDFPQNKQQRKKIHLVSTGGPKWCWWTLAIRQRLYGADGFGVLFALPHPRVAGCFFGFFSSQPPPPPLLALVG
jgi:hypothetical protein